MWCYSSLCAWLVFSPGKCSLLHKMLPTKRLLRKLACKYHLLNVAGHMWVLSVISALLLSKMEPRWLQVSCCSPLRESHGCVPTAQTIPALLTISRDSRPGCALPWVFELYVSPLLPTKNHQNKVWSWRDVWPRCVQEMKGLPRGHVQGAFNRGKRMFGQRSGRMRKVDETSKKMRDPNHEISMDW